MRTMFSLTRVLFLGSGYAGFGTDARQRRKLAGKIGNGVLFAFLGVYLLAISSVTAWSLYDLLAPAKLGALMVGLFLSAGVTVVFLFGILYVMSVFYFSSDVEKLLPLPLRPEQIIAAKFLVSLLYEYLFLAVLVLPALTVYGIRSQAPVAYYPMLLVVFLVLPVVPLALASIMVMLLMRFTTFARNKDRFNMVSMLLALGLSLGFTFGMQSLATMERFDLTALLTASASTLARITSSAFPGTAFAAAALTEASLGGSLLNLALLLVCVSVAFALVLAAGRLLYFKGVIGITASGSNRKRLSKEELRQAGQGGSAFLTYMTKDIRILVRTPIYFANCVLMNFLWPLFILLPFLSGSEGISISQLRTMLHPLLFEGDRPGLALSLAIACAGSMLLASFNGIAASALSREGNLLYIMKVIPMSYTRQVIAKAAVGMAFSAVGCLMIVPFVIYFLMPPVWYMLLLAVIMPGALLVTNLSGILFDLMWPKLHWENEAVAVKRNMNVLLAMLAALFMAGLVAGPILLLKPPVAIVIVLVTIFPMALSACLAILVRHLAPRLIRSIQA